MFLCHSRVSLSRNKSPYRPVGRHLSGSFASANINLGHLLRPHNCYGIPVFIDEPDRAVLRTFRWEAQMQGVQDLQQATERVVLRGYHHLTATASKVMPRTFRFRACAAVQSKPQALDVLLN